MVEQKRRRQQRIADHEQQSTPTRQLFLPCQHLPAQQSQQAGSNRRRRAYDSLRIPRLRARIIVAPQHRPIHHPGEITFFVKRPIPADQHQHPIAGQQRRRPDHLPPHAVPQIDHHRHHIANRDPLQNAQNPRGRKLEVRIQVDKQTQPEQHRPPPQRSGHRRRPA